METLVTHDVDVVFGVVGSAYMDALDIFPAAGIRFLPVQHEQNAATMADAYARITGKVGVCIAQNGPGVTNLVTGIATAFWAHSPVLAITPEGASTTAGLGGFQETVQMPLFSEITKFQAQVNDPERLAELTDRCIRYALLDRGPTQINVPRDKFFGEVKAPDTKKFKRNATGGGEEQLQEAAKRISMAKRTAIVAGYGVVASEFDGVKAVENLADYMGAPVATTYLHNDAFPASNALALGPLGYQVRMKKSTFFSPLFRVSRHPLNLLHYECAFFLLQGSKAAMKVLSKADLILAVGTRLGPFGTLPQYGIDYWPQQQQRPEDDCYVIQV